MHSKVLAIDNATDRQAIEELHEQIVNLNIISRDGLLSESKVLSHVPAFVVASNQNHIFRVVELNAHEENEDLDSISASVHIIS